MKTKHTFGEVRKFDIEEAEKTRTIPFIISTERKDRHRTVLNIEGWDLGDYERNGIVGYQHDVYGSFFGESNPDMVIGKGKVWVEDRQLVGEVTFEPADINPFAEKIFRKILFGSLKAASVGFLPMEDGRFGEGEEARGKANETYYYGKRQLLEWSIVNIPSNADAIARKIEDEDMKEFEEEKHEEPDIVPDAHSIMKMSIDLINI